MAAVASTVKVRILYMPLGVYAAQYWRDGFSILFRRKNTRSPFYLPNVFCSPSLNFRFDCKASLSQTRKGNYSTINGVRVKTLWHGPIETRVLAVHPLFDQMMGRSTGSLLRQVVRRYQHQNVYTNYMRYVHMRFPGFCYCYTYWTVLYTTANPSGDTLVKIAQVVVNKLTIMMIQVLRYLQRKCKYV